MLCFSIRTTINATIQCSYDAKAGISFLTNHKRIFYIVLCTNMISLFHITAPTVNSAYTSYRSINTKHSSSCRRKFFMMSCIFNLTSCIRQTGKCEPFVFLLYSKNLIGISLLPPATLYPFSFHIPAEQDNL